VRAEVAGYIGTVRVTEQYKNPFAEKIEAVYVFPLPTDAAVTDFLMVIGERQIRGIIREREEAERVYEEAKRQGYVASLLTQERPNVFTQSVANIEPGKSIDVTLSYFHTLPYADGAYEFVFPMVVGPRFNPPGSTSGIGAVARGHHGSSGQPTEVQYLAPDERSGHDISLTVDIDAGMSIESVSSPTHRIEDTVISADRHRVTLHPSDTIPNKDFVLRYTVAGNAVKSALLTHRDDRGSYFTFMLEPPAELENVSRTPVEFIFVLDCSGSMDGYPIAAAKGAASRALGRLRPDDTFQIVRFSDNSSQLGAAPVPATESNIARGLSYIEGLNGEGGTMMIEGIRAALDFPHDPKRLRVVSFMTDGYIGNEVEILHVIHQRLGSARIFSFGVGSSPNRYLLERMALVGNGAVAFIGPETPDAVVDGFYERVRHPALADVEIDWGGMTVRDVYPKKIPDLFVGRPVVVTGRFEGKTDSIRVRGNAGGAPIEMNVRVNPDSFTETHDGIRAVWARQKIAELEDEVAYGGDKGGRAEVTNVALQHGMMSAYTAFVAVDSSTRTAGTHGTTVAVPVPMPEGVPYETTVEE
jgi:Ca-activated chloride channel family protein